MKRKHKTDPRKQRELAEAWDKTQAAWDKLPKFARSADKPQDISATTGFVALDRHLGGIKPGELFVLGARSNVGRTTVAADRDTSRIPSRDTGAGSTAPAPTKVYTGTKLVGIATMHKSNMVPVFSADEALEVAKMRRN